jgi:hypothetical protein
MERNQNHVHDLQNGPPGRLGSVLLEHADDLKASRTNVPDGKRGPQLQRF